MGASDSQNNIGRQAKLRKNTRLDVFSVVKIEIVAFWIMIPCKGKKLPQVLTLLTCMSEVPSSNFYWDIDNTSVESNARILLSRHGFLPRRF